MKPNTLPNVYGNLTMSDTLRAVKMQFSLLHINSRLSAS